MDIPGYEVGQEVLRTGLFAVFRARRAADEEAVLLETPVRFPPGAAALDGLERTLGLLTDLRIPGAPRPLELIRWNGTAALVLADPGLEPLRNRLQPGPLGLPAFFAAALALCDALADVHRLGMTLGAVSPDNTLASPDGSRVQFADFTVASRAAQGGGTPGLLAFAATPYTSPEQTGRINRVVDHRSDIYALGATLYELLTGRPPFSSEDSLELIHAHIARTPEPPSSLDPAVPEQVSRIVMKLLAKAAEDRYQSVTGARHDLETSARAWQAHGQVMLFDLGRQDVSEHFLIPQRLYGRDAELAALLSAFESTCEGATSLMLVSGYSGIGKTSLIGEISRRIVRQRGYFVTGKFDQVVRNIPHGALVQAFRSLIWQVLAESEERLTVWRTRLSTALGATAGVLAEVLPEIEIVLGKQPPPTPLDPAEAQNRFRYVFESFAGALAGADSPLVIFLDDLQWVDAATLDLLQALLTSPETRHLLIIGAYRDNEVDPDHLLAWAIGRLEASGAPVGRVTLGPLGRADLARFLRDTLHGTGNAIDSLAALILQKTDGNPFFVIQFLKTLHQQGLFSLDRKHGCWTFSLEQIAAAGITENVIDLMTRRIERLSPAAQKGITIAACIGNPFDAATFLTASGGPTAAGLSALTELRDEGLIQQTTALGSPHERDPARATYAFLHDRVQQAAYELLPSDDRRTVHLDVGRLLWQQLGPDVPEDRLFEVVGHLNLGADLIADEQERRRVARLNLAAGRKAKLSTAYQAASTYLEAGIGLLPENAWAGQYELMFALHLESAECQYLSGQFEAAEGRFETLLSRAQSASDRAQVHGLRIVLYENLSRFDDAVTSGREGLALYGLVFPSAPADLERALDAEIARTQSLLEGRRIESLIELPVMQDPDVRTLMRLLTALWAPAYISGNHLLARLISATMVRLSLEHGNTEDSAYGYVTHAITIGPVRRDYRSAYEWGELALRVNEWFDDTKRRAKIHQQFHAHVKLWRRPFETCIPHAREARRAALESGDFTYAGYATVSESWPAMLVAHSLDQFVREYSTAFPLLERIRMAEFREALRVMINWAQALQGKTAGPLSLTNSQLDEAAFVAKYAGSAPFFLTFYYTARLQLGVLHGRYPEALEMARLARAVTLPGTIWPVLVEFWESLAIGGIWLLASDEDRRALLPRIDDAVQSLRTLAASCPENFRCFALLSAATRHRLDRRFRAALELAEEAIAYAREIDNVQLHAVACELGAELAREGGDDVRAAGLVRAAHRSYARWGALAKTHRLEELHPGLTTSAEPAGPAATTLQPGGSDPSALDIATVLKLARAIAVELELDGLLRQLLRIALENAGAERAVFLEDRNGALLVEGEAVANPPAVRLRLSAPIDDSAPFALGVVRYVRRTGQDVVVPDAAMDDRFAGDPYIAAGSARSLLCVPVSHQGRTTGVLYLENNLTRDAFTPQRVEMMRVLAAQASISLENARLYDGMKTEVDRRTRAEQSLREALAELEVLKNRLEAENVYLQEEIRTQHNFDEIVGNSPALLDALRRVELVAPTDSTVLILGETGSGKELFARAIHSRSRRAARPLVKVNCGAIAPGLVESELFGHVKGAFTGAIDKRLGRFELANGGTILLDEIGELPLEAQVKLLRVLQEQEFEPVGSSRTVRVDVRVIAATNRDLGHAVRDGTFRADLLYRLNVFPISVPPLRRRRNDVPLLAGLFVTGLARKLGKPLERFSARSMERLMDYSWPGNVRELQNVVERAAIVARGPILELDPAFAGVDPAAPAEPERPPDGKTLDQVQRSHIVEVLKMTGGVVEGTKGAATILGLHPNTLRSRMKKLGITVPRPSN
ncbi:MAG TPA: sigma 54-interacting transcriptional regulator [Vicinamibacterales bacterium]|nr:sigma 54-interacting transcriptional regulator [Vicinamibacterales bacterium]